MAVTCNACGAQNVDNATFCSLCSKPLGQAAAQAPPPPSNPYSPPTANPYESRVPTYSYSSESGGGNASGWGTAGFSALGLLGAFLPMIGGEFGRGSTLIAGARDAKILWIFPLALLSAGLIGLGLSIGNMSQRAGWFALAGVLAGISGTLSIFMVYGATLGGTSGLGIGFWCTVVGSIGSVVASVIGAFKES